MSLRKIPNIEGAPGQCKTCHSALCLRKQVINLALGNTDEMYCLECLAKESDVTPADVLCNTKQYLVGRECFRKEWVKYESDGDCPDPDNCLPGFCFS